MIDPSTATTEISCGELTKNQRDVISKKIITAIDAYAVERAKEPFRWRLGASIIGHECDRYLWASFRWLYKNEVNGRMSRLYQRGKDEEPRFEELLIGAGFKTESVDPSTGKQYYFSNHEGHFGGSMDGKLWFPPSWNIPGMFVQEFKTNQTGATFNNLDKEGLEIAKEQHFVQTSLYCVSQKTPYGVYLNANKNDDSLYCEIVEASIPKAEAANRRAYNIITTDYAPAMIPGAKETFFKCRGCANHAVCHLGVPVQVNCRSCAYATPVENAQWKCGKYGQNIPKDFVYQGCEDHKAII